VVAYGHSEPRIILVESGLEITVDTDKDEYALDENVEIAVTATNNTAETMKLEFRSGQQASYSIDGVYHYTDHHAAPLVLTEVILESGKSETWNFTHTPDDYRLLPGPHCIVGVVIGYGKSEPKKIFVAEGPPPAIEVSVSTDKNEYEPGEPVKIDVTATNTSDLPVTLRFPTSHQADYLIDDVYQWSRGKLFLPIATSVTLPAGAQMTWHFVHRAGDYRLLPGEHSIVGMVVGYGRSEPVTIVVKEEEPWYLTVRGLLLKEAPPDPNGGPYGGHPPYFLYTGDPEKVYCLFPQNVDLEPHVNKTVEVKGGYIYTLLPVPGIPLGVISIRDLLQVEVATDKVKYYPEEDIHITLIARNVTDRTKPETLTINIDAREDVCAWVDDTRLFPEGVPMTLSPYFAEPLEIEPGDTAEWTFIYKAEGQPLSPGRHIVKGEVRRYGRSDRLPIEVILNPVDKIVAEGIVGRLDDDILAAGDVMAPRYVLVDRLTGEKLYTLLHPCIDLGRYLGQYVEVIGVPWEKINYRDATLDTEQAIPSLYVLSIRRLLAVALSTNKVFYSPSEDITVYVTAKNCTPEEMTLTFSSEEQAYYSIDGNTTPDDMTREMSIAESEVTIPPYGLHVWTFTHSWGETPPELGSYTVTGGVHNYGVARPMVITVEESPAPIVTARGVIERFWWYRWFEPCTNADCVGPEPWVLPCRYVLFDPEQKQILYFLSSHRVELNWYIGRNVEVTGYPARDAVILEEPKIEVLPAGWGNGDPGDPGMPFYPPILWPPVDNHLDVVSVIPLGDAPPEDENDDGIPDAWEIITGLRALGANKGEDSDGDGVPNGMEYFHGTDPLDPASFVDVGTVVSPAGLVVLRWNTVLGKVYSVHCADGGQPGPLQWRLLVHGIAGTGERVEWTDDGGSDTPPSNAANVRCRFYRVKVE
jgi:hypothetical protein